jgi:hypothetical protein
MLVVKPRSFGNMTNGRHGTKIVVQTKGMTGNNFFSINLVSILCYLLGHVKYFSSLENPFNIFDFLYLNPIVGEAGL